MPAPDASAGPLAPFLDPLETLGLPYCITAPPEYVILRKLEFLREGAQDKHVRDIRFILASTDSTALLLTPK